MTQTKPELLKTIVDALATIAPEVSDFDLDPDVPLREQIELLTETADPGEVTDASA